MAHDSCKILHHIFYHFAQAKTSKLRMNSPFIYNLSYNQNILSKPNKYLLLQIKDSYDLDSLKNGIKECGIFVAPYIAEAEIRGNNNLASVFDVKSFSKEELRIIKDMVEKNHNN